MAQYWLLALAMLVQSACSVREMDFDASAMVLPPEGGSFTCRGMSITLGRFLQEGLHGQVFTAMDANGKSIAVKRTTRVDEDFNKECTMQNALAEKIPGHVPKCLALCDDNSVPGKQNILIMEMVEGAQSLTSWIQAHTDEDVQTKKIAAQTLFILNVMLRQGIANNDQMPEKNILVDKSDAVWFIDFGLACYKTQCQFPDPEGIESGMIYTVLKEFRASRQNQNKFWTWDQLQEAYCCLSTVGNHKLTHEMTDIAKTHDMDLKKCKCDDDDPEDCRSCRKFKQIMPMIKASK